MAYGAILGQTPKATQPQSDFPIGGIIIWSGNENNIPNNWHLCDGTNSTPDLRNRFILGYGTKNCGIIGGNETVSLSIENMPAHSHNATLDLSNLSTSVSGNHSHEYKLNISTRDSISTTSSTTILIPGQNGKMLTIMESGSHSHNVNGSGSVSIENTGSNEAYDNMPPYYVLCYIMKIA